MKSQYGINYLAEVIEIKKKSELLVQEINTFLTEPEGTNFKHYIWIRVENRIKELAEAIK